MNATTHNVNEMEQIIVAEMTQFSFFRTFNGQVYYLLLDPEDRSVTVHSGDGNTISAVIWHRRAVAITVPGDLHGAYVQEWAQEHLEEIGAVFERYQGTRWTGSNQVGVWATEVDEMLDELEEDLRCADLPIVYSPAEYLDNWARVEAEPAIIRECIRAIGAGEIDALFDGGDDYVAESGRAQALRQFLDNHLA